MEGEQLIGTGGWWTWFLHHFQNLGSARVNYFSTLVFLDNLEYRRLLIKNDALCENIGNRMENLRFYIFIPLVSPSMNEWMKPLHLWLMIKNSTIVFPIFKLHNRHHQFDIICITQSTRSELVNLTIWHPWEINLLVHLACIEIPPWKLFYF